MIKLKDIIKENNILISRRNKQERMKQYQGRVSRKIKKYIHGGSDGDLDFTNDKNIEYLPEELKYVGGTLWLVYSTIQRLPVGLEVAGNLMLIGASIKKLPDGLVVRGNLELEHSKIEELPNGLTVGGGLNLLDTPIKRLPDDLTVGRALTVWQTKLNNIPMRLNVGENLFIWGTPVYEKYRKYGKEDEASNKIKQLIIERGGSVGGNII